MIYSYQYCTLPIPKIKNCSLPIYPFPLLNKNIWSQTYHTLFASQNSLALFKQEIQWHLSFSLCHILLEHTSTVLSSFFQTHKVFVYSTGSATYFPGNPISVNIFSSFSILNSNGKKGDSKIIELETRRRSFFKPSVSAQQESQPYQRNGKDRSSSNDFQEEDSLSILKSLIKAYKEAVSVGDEKTIYEIEDMLCMVDKDNKDLVEKISVLSAEISSGKEKYIRLQADFDNYRKRAEKERLTVRSNAQGEVIESLLPMVDSFERAKQQIKLETEKEKKIDTSYQGIYKQFVKIMRSLRVTAVPTVGKPFDPSMHEAIAREVSHEFKEGIVTQEFRRGFLLGDCLLRPAMVKVSSGPGKRKPPAVQERLSTQPPSVVGLENP